MKFLKMLISLGLTQEGTNGQKIEGMIESAKQISEEDISSGKGSSKSKGPEAGAHLRCLGSIQITCMTAVKAVMGYGGQR